MYTEHPWKNQTERFFRGFSAFSSYPVFFLKIYILLILSLVTDKDCLANTLSVNPERVVRIESMANIPDGYFSPPFPGDSLKAPVFVPGFTLDIHPVTIEEFLNFVKKNPDWKKSKASPIFHDENYLEDWTNDSSPPPNIKENWKYFPVTSISWHAAKAYCASQDKRLPTTIEWERVAATRSSKQDSAKVVNTILDWYARPAHLGTNPLGSGTEHDYNVRDMYGLVWEWTSDFKSWGYATFNTNSAADSALYCGGGGNRGNTSDYITYMRYGIRSSLKSQFSLKSMGFRCAK